MAQKAARIPRAGGRPAQSILTPTTLCQCGVCRVQASPFPPAWAPCQVSQRRAVRESAATRGAGCGSQAKARAHAQREGAGRRRASERACRAFHVGVTAGAAGVLGGPRMCDFAPHCLHGLVGVAEGRSAIMMGGGVSVVVGFLQRVPTVGGGFHMVQENGRGDGWFNILAVLGALRHVARSRSVPVDGCGES